MTHPIEQLKAETLGAIDMLLRAENCASMDIGALPGGQRVLVGDDAAIRRLLDLRNEADQ